MFGSIRTRLTLWYAGVLALSLVAFAFLVYYWAAGTFYERQDESLRSTAETVASAYQEELAEVKSVNKANEVLLSEIVFPNRYVEILDTSGRPVAWSTNLNGNLTSVPESTLLLARQRGAGYSTANGLRVAVVPLSSKTEIGFAAVAEPVSVIDEELHRLRSDVFAAVPLILVFASFGGYFLARKNLAPIELMNEQTQLITARSLSSRLDVGNSHDELGRLGTTINELLARLESSFNEQQRFIADASHELRTPLAVLRGETEVALNRSRSAEEYRDSLALIQDEAERLSRIVEDLFVLARQPLTAPKMIKERVSLTETVRDCGRAAEVLASRKQVRLKTETDSTNLILSGDDELLKRMILNLLDNAVKYTDVGGEVLLSLKRKNGNAQITVADNGVGISQSDQEHVFDRFYRVDKARSRAHGGAGLGLSIAQWIVDAHAGNIKVESEFGKGSKFTVELPLTQAS